MRSFSRGRFAAALGVLVGVGAGLFFWQQNVVQAGNITLSGTVTTPSGGVYADGGGVNMWGQAGSGWSNIDPSGRFEITGLSAGSYTLDVGVSNTSSYANPPQQQVTLTATVTNFSIAVSTPVLTGTLALPDGTPSSGCVNVRNSTWTVNRNSCPSDDGRFKIGGLDAGTYILQASPNSNSLYVTSEQTVTVTDPATMLDLGLVRFDTPFVVGKLALPDGTPVPWSDNWDSRLHISVDLWNSDRTIDRHSDYDSSSNFKFGRMPAGDYTIHANIWGTELYTGSVNVTISVPAAGLDITGTPLLLTTPQLSGVVTNPDGTTPIRNAWVNLHNDDWSQNQGSSTGDDGKYRIGGLPAGTYWLEVNPPNELTDVVRPDPVQVSITASLTTRNITLSAAKKFVNGTVKKTNGVAVSCAWVSANRRDGSGWANGAVRSDGTFTLTLTPGSWGIRVEPDNSFSCPQPDWVFLNQESIVTFSNDSSTQTETVNLVVDKATAKISGKVILKNGSPVTNGNVNANSQTKDGRNRWANAPIKADGAYTLNLVGGTYDLNVWTPDNRQYVRNQKVTVNDNETTTVNFTVSEKLAHITGTVTSRDGKALPNIQLNGNLDCGPNGCSAWSNTKTDANGFYDLAATEGRWNLNFDAGRGATYVYDGPPTDVYVPSETATVSNINFALTYADVTIKGNVVDESGTVFSDFYGWAYVRPTTVTADTGMREYGGSVDRGAFQFRVPSRLYSQAELGVHTPPNSPYSSLSGTVVTLVADATIEKNIVLKRNDAAIVGRLVDSTGLPLKSCNFRGEVFANTDNGEWHGTQVNPDCTYEISLLAGSYRIGSHIEESAGFLNRPPTDHLVTVASGTRAEYNIKVLVGDARVSVLVLNPDGSPARRVWVWADNHEEIDRMRQSAEQQGKDENFRGPGDTKSFDEVLKFCSEKKNEQECKDFKLPPGSEGPGSCKDALACTQYCKKHKNECKADYESKGPSPKSVKLSGSVLRQKAAVKSLRSVRAAATDQGADDAFDSMINTGSETNDKGVATLSLLSGHEYTANAGLPPESSYLPPKYARVSLLSQKNANVTLTLRTSDGSMSGFVLWKGVAVRNGWVGCWGEDGSNTGSPVFNGTYKMNYSFNTLYHCNANAVDGTSFLHSDEQIVTIATEKSKKLNFSLDEAAFQIPPSVSESFDSTSAHVLTLADGTNINIPANTLASSGTVTVNANPTINIQSQKTAQPLGYGYQLEATDETGKAITTFNGNITMCFTYTDQQLSALGLEEATLVPNYWDAASSSWKLPPNTTHDTDNNKICVSSNHFTAYAVVSTSGKGRGQQLTAVNTSKKNGITKITIGTGKQKKTVTPFPKYKGNVDVVTFRASKKAGQVIVATQQGADTATTALKIYGVNGKLTRTSKPWGSGYKQGAAISAGDLTGDSYADLVAAPLSGRRVQVTDFAKKKSHTVDAPSSGRVLAKPLDLLGRGSVQLAVSTGSRVETWKIVKGKLARFSYDARKIRVTGSSIERVTLKPTIAKVTPGMLVAGKGTTTITITGENLGSGSRVLLGQTIPAKKVTAKGDTTLIVTIDKSKLKRNKRYDVTVINGDGEQITSQSVRTKK